MSSGKALSAPNRNEFDKKMNDLKQQLADQLAIQKKAKAAIEAATSAKGRDPEWDKLIQKQAEARATRDAAKANLQEHFAELKTMDLEVQKKVKDIAALRPKNGAKSAAQIEAQIKALEREAESGELSMLREKEVFNQIKSLRVSLRQFGGINKLQTEIDATKAKMAELRKTIDDRDLKAAQAELASISQQLDDRKSSRMKEQKKLDVVYNERRAATAQIKKIKEELDTTREEFSAKMTAFRQQNEQLKKQRALEAQKQKVEAARAKKVAAAIEKLEAAQLPAFGPQIARAEAVYAYFDPSFKPSSAASLGEVPALTRPSDDSLSTARSVRKVDQLPEGAKLINKAAAEAPVSRKMLKRKTNTAAKTEDASSKFRLDLDIIADLASMNIPLPSSADEIESTKTKLMEKIQFYKDNNKRVTAERIERATAELEKAKAEAALPFDAAETSTDSANKAEITSTSTSPADVSDTASGADGKASAADVGHSATEATTETENSTKLETNGSAV